MTLKPVELEATRSEPPRLLHKPSVSNGHARRKDKLVDPWAKPLFNTSAYERP